MQVAELNPNPVSFDEVAALAHDDMLAVNRLISSSLATDVALVSQVSEYIVKSGGKRLRPVIVLLAAHALGYEGEQHVRAATIIEFIHTATLLHDDVVDSSERRRGKDSANTVFGNQASVLVGDFLYSRAFQMMVDIDSMRVMQILANATNTIAAGEVMQLMNVHDPDTTEEAYRMVIYRKTARLFEAGAQIAAVLSGTGKGVEASVMAYGQNLGTAFQLIDDALDYNASTEELGKNIGDDLAEGKPTLPLIYAMQQGNDAERQMIRAAIENGGLEHIEEITRTIRDTGALEYTHQQAIAHADKAKAEADARLAELRVDLERLLVVLERLVAFGQEESQFVVAPPVLAHLLEQLDRLGRTLLHERHQLLPVLGKRCEEAVELLDDQGSE